MERMPNALVILAEGAEEMETVIVVDVLRRADIDVALVGLDGRAAVRCSRGVVLVPDRALESTPSKVDIIVLPGGAGGAKRLADSHVVGEWLRGQERAQRMVGAICAAPEVLAVHRVFGGRRMTSHPSVAERVSSHGLYVEAAVVEDGPLVTSRGPGTTFPFALTIVERLRGRDVADRVRSPMMLDPT